ncbi:hypothetical protein ACR4XW_15855, partial [Enemella sp. A6]
AMAANTGERTLIPAIIPPGAAHPNGVFCLGGDAWKIVQLAGVFSSLLSDLAVRAAPKSGIYQGVVERLFYPGRSDSPLVHRIGLRILRLNCLTHEYAPLWRELWIPQYSQDSWLLDDVRSSRPRLADVGPEWTTETPLRRDLDRRNALVEIDALVSLLLGITAAEICSVYRTHFPVLFGYDRNEYLFDAEGRVVPTSIRKQWRTKGDDLSHEERTEKHASGTVYTYKLPFVYRDREKDMRLAMDRISNL